MTVSFFFFFSFTTPIFVEALSLYLKCASNAGVLKIVNDRTRHQYCSKIIVCNHMHFLKSHARINMLCGDRMHVKNNFPNHLLSTLNSLEYFRRRYYSAAQLMFIAPWFLLLRDHKETLSLTTVRHTVRTIETSRAFSIRHNATVARSALTGYVCPRTLSRILPVVR